MVNTAGTFCRCPVSYSVCGFLHALGLRRCQSTSGWVVFCLLCAKSTSKLYCTSRENMDISVYTAALPQSSLASNYSGNSLSFSNDTRLFLSFFLSELKCWEGRLEHLFMHLNYPSSLLPQILVCIQTGYRWQHFFGWKPTIILFLSVTVDESVMKILATGQSGEVFVFLVRTPDVYVMCLSLLWNTKYLWKAPRSIHG